MPLGGGKYDDLCTQARLASKASGVVLIVIDGEKGFGFEVQASLAATLRLPTMLRHVADQIEASHGKGEL